MRMVAATSPSVSFQRWTMRLFQDDMPVTQILPLASSNSTSKFSFSRFPT